jgi:hypothetical protein
MKILQNTCLLRRDPQHPPQRVQANAAWMYSSHHAAAFAQDVL